MGSGKVRNIDYYRVFGVSISRERKLIPEGVDAKERIIYHEEFKYFCSCKDCSIKRIPNDKEPRCKFVRILKKYLGDKN